MLGSVIGHEQQFENRVDRRNLEPRARMYEGQPRLRALLR